MTVRGALGRAVDRLEPRPRVVDWSLLALVAAEALTGLVSFVVATPDGWPVFWLHRSLGVAIVALLFFKLRRVRRNLTEPGRWRRSTALSVLAAVAALGALATGAAWVFGLDVRVSLWTLLSVHVAFGLLLLVVVPLHAATRFRLPRRADVEGRRTALQYTALFVAGAVTYRVQTALNTALDTAGADRRFTGSQPREGEGNDAFPPTSWVADDPEPVDRERYRLAVTGEVTDSLALPVEAVASGEAERALLDCTSGWYTVQDWRGVRVGDLLDAAGGTTEDASHVRFVSVTGYRWTLPVEEARDALLATHVGGERLSHGHGAPVRLVAPGRRGFQWVKWVTRVEVRPGPDPAQWVVTLVSGFD
ncbi:molybdopterin-dependent oxidoreductase [Halobacterium jilantaiense]|uniref:Oxidoreductase molybdopterin binding domain-containing protein n=1 Tax=Halobacterium jilantaiense TaxID=355548 RepID=A0A1I0Q7I6_9EURY|nr:molybdopterin-dependent oxidoreductase [Halobacterium jilantaiense]SEW22944.1 Oxidoreductase molybdopterin binding domain-containing protein [Halobacterium jilantaiense]